MFYLAIARVLQQFNVNRTMNNDDDFSKYSLIGSIKTESPQSGAPKMWDTLLYETQSRSF